MKDWRQLIVDSSRRSIRIKTLCSADQVASFQRLKSRIVRDAT